jgi:acetyl esterase
VLSSQVPHATDFTSNEEVALSYSFDPELAPWAATLPATDYTDVATARSQMAAILASRPAGELPANVAVRDLPVPGAAGAPDVPVRVYTPAGRAGPLPALLYIHGGGFILGDLDSFHAGVARIAAEVGAVAVSVDYRLAPEHPFPAGLEDCYAALVWTVEHAADLDIDTGRVAVGGESAGGGLAAAVALLARDRGGPALCFQYLGVPVLDDRLDTPSMTAFVDTPLWNRPKAALSWKYYLSGPTTVDGRDGLRYAAPARAEDLSGLPPAYVTTCEFDPLRDEGLQYAMRLLQAGVSTEVHNYPGTFHGSTAIAEAAVSKRMAADQLDALRRGMRAHIIAR